jgi:glycine oxidase
MTRSAADTLIVGGGLIGCALACELSERGQRVVVLERGEPGAEASSAAAGMLSPQSDARSRDADFELGHDSLALYPDWTRRLTEETGVDTGFRRSGTLKCAFTDSEREALTESYGWQKSAGLEVEVRTGDSLERDRAETGLSRDVVAAALFPAEGVVSPRPLARAAWLTAERRGVLVLSGVAVRRFLLDRGRCIGVETEEGILSSGAVVDAAGAWAAFDLGLPFGVPVRPVRGQIVALRVEGAPSQRVVCSDDVYALPRADGTVLIGSTLETVGFRKAVTAGAVARLVEAAVRLVPRLAESRFEDAWSGLRPGTPDGWPILGPSPVRGLFFAAGHFRSGILLAPITARLVADAIVGAPDPRLEAFSIERFAGRLSVS